MMPVGGGTMALQTVCDPLATSRERRQEWIEAYISGSGHAPADYLRYCDQNPTETGDPRGGLLPSHKCDIVVIDDAQWAISKGYCREDVARSLYHY